MITLKHTAVFLICCCTMSCNSPGQVTAETDRSAPTTQAQQGLLITSLGKEYQPNAENLAFYQKEASMGGSTSVRNVDQDHLEWKQQGYFQRNRDLGQVFTPEKDFWLDAIVLRTGPSDKAVLSQTPGAKVFLQFYRVEGSPHIHDNDTPAGTEALHGFTKNHRADDYIEGVTYTPMVIVKGGTFPEIPPSFENGQPVNGDAGKLVYMRWKLTGPPLKFDAGKRYAFMVGFEEPGEGFGFTLANINGAGIDAPPSVEDEHDLYHGGWGLRREGDGTTPPTMKPAENAPANREDLSIFYRESLFGTGADRYALNPTTDGYPDVDTYRDLNFALEVFWENPVANKE